MMINYELYQLELRIPNPWPQILIVLDFTEEQRSFSLFAMRVNKGFKDLGPFCGIGFLTLFLQSIVINAQQSATQVLDGIFAQYDKAVRPYYGEKPVEVTLSVYIIAIQGLSEANMDFTATMYLRQGWTDQRLTYRPQRGINTTVHLDENRAKQLWIPDTFFVNEKKSLLHMDTTKNEFVRLSSTGALLKSARYTMTFGCPMNLRFFPFDDQTCNVDLESFSGTKNEITFKVDNSSVQLATDISMVEFRVTGLSARNRDVMLTQGNYSRVAITLNFRRSSRAYLLRCYAPLGAAVIVSLVALLFAYPVVAPVIHIVNIFFIISYSAHAWILKPPKVSYLRLLDVYFLICLGHMLLCVIVSLMESRGQRNEEVTEVDAYRGIRNGNQPRRKSFCSVGNILFCCLKLTIITLFVVSNVLYYVFLPVIPYAVNEYYSKLTKFS